MLNEQSGLFVVDEKKILNNRSVVFVVDELHMISQLLFFFVYIYILLFWGEGGVS